MSTTTEPGTDPGTAEAATPLPDGRAVPEEVPRWFQAGDETVLSVLTRPIAPARDVGVIFLNGGHGGSSAGKNRVHTRMADDLARRGFHSLRVEWHGIGDSTGEIDEFVMDDPFVDEALGAVQVLRDEGISRVAIYGECFGARTAVVCEDRIPELCAMFLVTLVIRDGALSEQTPQRVVSELDTGDFVKRLDRVRHLGDPEKRALYLRLIKSKSRQLFTTAKLRAAGSKLEPWVSPQVVAGLDDLGTRGIPVHLVYGTSYWDPHTGDFVKIRDDLKPMRHDSITAEILDEMIAGYRTLQVQDRLVPMVGEWMDQAVPR
jgi:pimeloyl-ACP methyl ester carboxylesterase